MTKWLRPHSLSQRLLVSVGLSISTVGLAILGLNYRLMQSDLATQVHNRAQSITQSLEFSTSGGDNRPQTIAGRMFSGLNSLKKVGAY